MTFLPFMLKVSAALAGVAALLGLIFAGPSGAAGAAAGVVFVALAYTASTLLIARSEKANRFLMLPVALGTYFGKLVALFVLLYAVRDWAGLLPMVFGVAAAALIWIVAQAWWIAHAKIPYVTFDE